VLQDLKGQFKALKVLKVPHQLDLKDHKVLKGLKEHRGQVPHRVLKALRELKVMSGLLQQRVLVLKDRKDLKVLKVFKGPKDPKDPRDQLPIED
jgi:hypothetical protein